MPFSLSLSIMFTRLLNPLSMGLTLLVQTLVVSMTTGLFSYSFWFSYILFLIFIGGMLVLFIYVSSLAANEYFKFSLTVFMAFLFTSFIFSFIFMFMDPLTTSFSSSLPCSSITEALSTQKIVSWIYSTPLMSLTLFVIIYLLLTLIVVVKITKIFKGPLRISY
uniref:NADH dehydrogenase subunit 6 n=1 Tax=Myra affinis TaxID=2800677 RepID=UPI001FAF4402|nr:NADH dehydrogenase subunit 6 [Myra affinis]UJP67366.1 NADH dehydrogenase subunit 6 [Myra affinis]